MLQFFCSRIECTRNKKRTIIEVPDFNGKLNACLVGRNKGIPGQITNHLFRKNILIEVNGYDELLKFNEDFELILRVAKKFMFYGVNKVGFIQHIREGSWSKSDPNIAFEGVELFLDTALDKKLLPFSEIEQRRKENRLSLVKKLLTKRHKWNDVIPYINEAFDIIKPVNFKKFILFFLNKVLKNFKK